MITHRWLSTFCHVKLTPPLALRLCQTFGALSPLVLRPVVLQLANALDDSMPRLTTVPSVIRERPGGCLMVLDNASYHEIFRRAIVLPMVWSIGDDDVATLPAKLQVIEAKVIKTLASERTIVPVEPKQWRLQFDPGYVCKDLMLADELFATFDSAMISLSVGLIAAMQGLQPNHHAWGSAAWNDQQGLVRVDGLCAKIQTAIELGAKQFYLPHWQRDEVLKEYPESHQRIALQGLASGTSRELRSTIEPMLAAFTRQPTPPLSVDDTESFDRCLSFYFNQPAKSDSQKQFYKTHLFATIVARCRQATAVELRESRPTHLVTIASGDEDVAVIAILSSGVDHCLLLHSDDKIQTDIANDIKRRLDSERERWTQAGFTVPTVRVKKFANDSTISSEFARIVAEFIDDMPPENVVFDIKPGTKRMTYTLARLARPGNWICDFNQQFVNNRPLPGSERPELSRVLADETYADNLVIQRDRIA